MTSYDKDSSAAAIVLADFGESVIGYNQSTGFAINFERIIRIKILKKEGLNGQISLFPYTMRVPMMKN